MFSENIYLRDWEIEAKGKVKVLEVFVVKGEAVASEQNLIKLQIVN